MYTSAGDRVRTLDVASGREIQSAPGFGEIALSPDGSTLAVVRERQVALLEPERLTVKSVIDEDADIGGARCSRRRASGWATRSVDDTLVVRSLADPDAPAIRLSPKAGPGSIGFSPDERTLYSRGDDRLLVWDLVGDRRFVRSIPVDPQQDSDRVGTMVSPDGRTVANLIGGDVESFAVQFLDVKSGTRTPISAFRESNTYIADLSWRPDSRMFASVQNDQWVDLWDAATGQAAGQHRVPDRYGVVESVKFSGDSTRLVVGTHRGWVYSVDASTLEVLGKPVPVKVDVPIRGLAANGDGTQALVWIDRKLQLLDLTRGQVLETADPGLDAEGMGVGARRQDRRPGRQ